MKKNSLSETNQKVLMFQINDDIHKAALDAVQKILTGSIEKEILYPPKPNGELTQNEIRAMEVLKIIPNIQSALQKVISDVTAKVIFSLLNYLDGTGDPNSKFGKWTGVALTDLPDDDSYEAPPTMNHDAFYETYWEWRDKK